MQLHFLLDESYQESCFSAAFRHYWQGDKSASLGQNGIGKTTLLKLSGEEEADSGSQIFTVSGKSTLS